MTSLYVRMQNPLDAVALHLLKQIHLAGLTVSEGQSLQEGRPVDLDPLDVDSPIFVIEMETDHADIVWSLLHNCFHRGNRVRLQDHVLIDLDKELGRASRDHLLRRRTERAYVADDIQAELRPALCFERRLARRKDWIVHRKHEDCCFLTMPRRLRNREYFQ